MILTAAKRSAIAEARQNLSAYRIPHLEFEEAAHDVLKGNPSASYSDLVRMIQETALEYFTNGTKCC